LKTSPTQRSLKYLRDCGWIACVVEKYNRFAKVRQDAFGFGDILACRVIRLSQLRQIALVQTTTATHMSDRKKKILSLPTYLDWKTAGGLIILHGWSKKGPRGKRKTWEVVEEIL